MRGQQQNIGQGGNKLVSARESLERIRQRHEELADRMSAAEQLEQALGGDALDQKLAAAGIECEVVPGVTAALAAVNLFGGFLVTRRMLEMFKKKERKAPAAASAAVTASPAATAATATEGAAI